MMQPETSSNDGTKATGAADMFDKLHSEQGRGEILALLESKIPAARNRETEGAPPIQITIGELQAFDQFRDTYTHYLTIETKNGQPLFGHQVQLFREHLWGETAADYEPGLLAISDKPGDAIESVRDAYVRWGIEKAERALRNEKAQKSVDRETTADEVLPAIPQPDWPEQSRTPHYYCAPRPFEECLGTINDALEYRRDRIAAYKQLLDEELGIGPERVERLYSILARDGDTTRFERSLSADERQRFEAFFEGPLNQKDGPFEDWIEVSQKNPEDLVHETDKPALAEKIVGELAHISDGPPFERSDRFMYPVVALLRLRECGGSWKDVSDALVDKLRLMRAGNDAKELYAAYGEQMRGFALKFGLDLPLDEKLSRAIEQTGRTWPAAPWDKAAQRENGQHALPLGSKHPLTSQVKPYELNNADVAELRDVFSGIASGQIGFTRHPGAHFVTAPELAPAGSADIAKRIPAMNVFHVVADTGHVFSFAGEPDDPFSARYGLLAGARFPDGRISHGEKPDYKAIIKGAVIPWYQHAEAILTPELRDRACKVIDDRDQATGSAEPTLTAKAIRAIASNGIPNLASMAETSEARLAIAKLLVGAGELAERWGKGKESGKAQTLVAADDLVRQLGGRDLTAVPLRVALREFVQGKIATPELTRKIGAHIQSVERFGGGRDAVQSRGNER